MSHKQPPQGYYQPQPDLAGPAPKKKRRVFLWIFLAIQVLFIVWIITAGASTHGIPAYCHQGSNSQYIGLKGCESASQAGAGIGIALIIVFWCVVDIIVGGGYAVYRLASRRS